MTVAALILFGVKLFGKSYAGSSSLRGPHLHLHLVYGGKYYPIVVDDCCGVDIVWSEAVWEIIRRLFFPSRAPPPPVTWYTVASIIQLLLMTVAALILFGVKLFGKSYAGSSSLRGPHLRRSPGIRWQVLSNSC